MRLARMTGLIALSVVATTCQASARLVPPAPRPAEDAKHSKPVIPPPLQADRSPNKSELILVIAPTTSALNDPGTRADLDGSGPAPAPNKAIQTLYPVEVPTDTGRADLVYPARPAIQATRAWLTARYPHAPPHEA
jgi:hypothetical protein